MPCARHPLLLAVVRVLLHVVHAHDDVGGVHQLPHHAAAALHDVEAVDDARPEDLHDEPVAQLGAALSKVTSRRHVHKDRAGDGQLVRGARPTSASASASACTRASTGSRVALNFGEQRVGHPGLHAVDARDFAVHLVVLELALKLLVDDGRHPAQRPTLVGVAVQLMEERDAALDHEGSTQVHLSHASHTLRHEAMGHQRFLVLHNRCGVGLFEAGGGELCPREDIKGELHVVDLQPPAVLLVLDNVAQRGVVAKHEAEALVLLDVPRHRHQHAALHVHLRGLDVDLHHARWVSEQPVDVLRHVRSLGLLLCLPLRLRLGLGLHVQPLAVCLQVRLGVLLHVVARRQRLLAVAQRPAPRLAALRLRRAWEGLGERGGLGGVNGRDGDQLEAPVLVLLVAVEVEDEGVAGDDERWAATSTRPGAFLRRAADALQVAPVRRARLVLVDGDVVVVALRAAADVEEQGHVVSAGETDALVHVRAGAVGVGRLELLAALHNALRRHLPVLLRLHAALPEADAGHAAQQLVHVRAVGAPQPVHDRGTLALHGPEHRAQRDGGRLAVVIEQRRFTGPPAAAHEHEAVASSGLLRDLALLVLAVPRHDVRRRRQEAGRLVAGETLGGVVREQQRVVRVELAAGHDVAGLFGGGHVAQQQLAGGAQREQAHTSQQPLKRGLGSVGCVIPAQWGRGVCEQPARWVQRRALRRTCRRSRGTR